MSLFFSPEHSFGSEMVLHVLPVCMGRGEEPHLWPSSRKFVQAYDGTIKSNSKNHCLLGCSFQLRGSSGRYQTGRIGILTRYSGPCTGSQTSRLLGRPNRSTSRGGVRGSRHVRLTTSTPTFRKGLRGGLS